jgi:hypothetical protein
MDECDSLCRCRLPMRALPHAGTGPCDLGRYASTPGQTTSQCQGPCNPGRFGPTVGQTSLTCTGQCVAGYTCPAGSTNGTVTPCPKGYYCLAGAATPTLCAGKVGVPFVTLGVCVLGWGDHFFLGAPIRWGPPPRMSHRWLLRRCNDVDRQHVQWALRSRLCLPARVHQQHTHGVCTGAVRHRRQAVLLLLRLGPVCGHASGCSVCSMSRGSVREPGKLGLATVQRALQCGALWRRWGHRKCLHR